MRFGLPNNYRIANYTVIDQVGEGGFAYTYRIKNDRGGTYILKELFPQEIVQRMDNYFVQVNTDNPDFKQAWDSSVANFKDEAKALRDLNIDTIPRLVDSFAANGTLYIVQNFIDGQALNELIPEFQKLPNQKKNAYARYLLRHLLNTLSDVHNEGILHRDIKPSNIIIRRGDEIPILIDFGGVRFQIGGRTYHFNKRVWSPGFSSPEQISTQGMEQSESSDLYSLAATMYQLIFNERPPDSSARINDNYSRRFSELNQIYDEALLESIERAFSLKREDRFRTADEWVSTLAELDYKSIKGADSKFDISKVKPTYIGRDPGPGGIKLDTRNTAISRRHLEIRKLLDGYLLIDHSTNGTWLTDDKGQRTKVLGNTKIDSLNYVIDLAGDQFKLNELLQN